MDTAPYPEFLFMKVPETNFLHCIENSCPHCSSEHVFFLLLSLLPPCPWHIGAHLPQKTLFWNTEEIFSCSTSEEKNTPQPHSCMKWSPSAPKKHKGFQYPPLKEAFQSPTDIGLHFHQWVKVFVPDPIYSRTPSAQPNDICPHPPPEAPQTTLRPPRPFLLTHPCPKRSNAAANHKEVSLHLQVLGPRLQNSKTQNKVASATPQSVKKASFSKCVSAFLDHGNFQALSSTRTRKKIQSLLLLQLLEPLQPLLLPQPVSTGRPRAEPKAKGDIESETEDKLDDLEKHLRSK